MKNIDGSMAGSSSHVFHVPASSQASKQASAAAATPPDDEGEWHKYLSVRKQHGSEGIGQQTPVEPRIHRSYERTTGRGFSRLALIRSE